MKDHYRILRLPPTATHEEIKKSYRKLAHLYHPDKNEAASDSQLFIEIQEAYFILSDPKKKKHYDEERYFSGLSSRKEPVALTAEWLLNRADELQKHTSRMYSYDMNHQVLYDYTLLILSDNHLAFLKEENNMEANSQLAETLLAAVKDLKYPYYEKIALRLGQITPLSDEAFLHIQKHLKIRNDDKAFKKALPWLILLTVALLCFCMYLYARNRNQ